jgi:uncharacterized protein (DUF983 family)
MSTITCPRCGSPVEQRRFFNAVNKPFCSRCGWNLDRAESALAAKNAVMILLPAVIVIIALFAVFAASKANAPFIFVLPVFFSLIAAVPLWSYYSMRKAISAAKFTVNPDLAQAQPPLDPSLQMLQSLPRPRRVRFSFRGSFAAIAVMLAGILVFFGVVLATANVRHVPNNRGSFAMFFPLVFLLAVFAIIIAVPLFRGKRDLPLLRDGELALARVIAQQTVQQGKTSYSRIDYEFKTSSGEVIRNSCRDLTSSAFEEMTVPVFYDPRNPSKNIAACATYFKVVADSL